MLFLENIYTRSTCKTDNNEIGVVVVEVVEGRKYSIRTRLEI